MNIYLDDSEITIVADNLQCRANFWASENGLCRVHSGNTRLECLVNACIERYLEKQAARAATSA